MKRRQALALVGSAVGSAIAGCSGSDSAPETGDTTSSGDDGNSQSSDDSLFPGTVSNEASTLSVESHEAASASQGFELRVTVKNTSDGTATPRIIAYLFNDSGEQIEKTGGFPGPTTLSSGESYEFTEQVFTNPEEVTRYEITVEDTLTA